MAHVNLTCIFLKIDNFKILYNGFFCYLYIPAEIFKFVIPVENQGSCYGQIRLITYLNNDKKLKDLHF